MIFFFLLQEKNIIAEFHTHSVCGSKCQVAIVILEFSHRLFDFNCFFAAFLIISFM